MALRRLLQIGGLTFDSDITKFLLIVGAMAFAAPVVWWCGAQALTVSAEGFVFRLRVCLNSALSLSPALAHKGKVKVLAMQKAQRQRKREALEAAGEANWQGDGASDSDKDEDWDIERVLGEKVPIPRWAREEAAAAAAAGGGEAAAARGSVNTARPGAAGGTARDTSRGGAAPAGQQTARTGGTGRAGQAAAGGTTRRDSVLSQSELVAPSTQGGR